MNLNFIHSKILRRYYYEQTRGKKMNGWSIAGISVAVIGILVIILGAMLQSIDFMSFATGGIILLAIGLCMITGLPAILQIAGIWLAAVTIMIYIYSLPDTDFVIKVIGFIPTIALAFWVSFKFWK